MLAATPKTISSWLEIKMQKLTFAMATVVFAVLNSAASVQCVAQSLKGSRFSMERQNQQAVSYGYTFLETPGDVSSFVNEGHLVRIDETATLELHNVSYPYARPEVRTFIERFSDQYVKTCGERLIVTSLTRPIDEQPVNASSDSVHPTGMAVDMRVPSGTTCRKWLERTLLSMERDGVLDVTREKHPSHYHVAVFTKHYEEYVAAQSATASQQSVAASTAATITTKPVATGETKSRTKTVQTSAKQTQTVSSQTTHTVKEGETLWQIATLYGLSVKQLKKLNGLRKNVLQVGQVLQIHTGARASIASLRS